MKEAGEYELLPEVSYHLDSVDRFFAKETAMSGTGGTVYDPQPPRSDCDRLTFRTVLNSPVPQVVAHLQKDMKLDVIAETRSGGFQVAVAMYNGQRAGAITSDALARLLECMAQGNEYVAEVLNRAGARVEVQVRRK